MAGSIPESTIDEIRARTDIVDLISSAGVAIRRSGASYVACCPFHHEKTPSFHIRPEQGRYHCFGCGEDGDAFTFLMKHEGLTFVEAVKRLADRCGVVIEEKENPEAGLRKRLLMLHAELAQFYRRCLLKSAEAKAARAYLDARDLGVEVGEKFIIGYAPKSAQSMLTWAEKYGFSTEELAAAGVLLPPSPEINRWYHRFGGRLTFALQDRAGRTIGFSARILTNDKKRAKYVNSPETPLFHKSNILYAFDKAGGEIVKAKRREAIVCEGQIDVIRCHAAGFKTAVASLGTAFTGEHAALLKKCADSVVLVFDADGAGRKAAIRTGGEFLALDMPVRVATLPPGEDPDSLIRTQGAAAFQAALDEAESITAFQIRALRLMEEHPDSIDAVTRIARAAITTIAAAKSAIIRASLLEEAAKLLSLPVAALEEDLARLQSGGISRGRAQSPRVQEVSPPRPVMAPSTSPSPIHDVELSDFLGDAAPAETIPEDEDASAPANNPPSLDETTFCKFLYDRSDDKNIKILVQHYAPLELFEHPYVIRFITTWLKEGDVGIEQVRETLSKAECNWVDTILLTRDRTTHSEMDTTKIISDFLIRLWAAAIRRAVGKLNYKDPATGPKILRAELLIKKFEHAKSNWHVLTQLMNMDTLKGVSEC